MIPQYGPASNSSELYRPSLGTRIDTLKSRLKQNPNKKTRNKLQTLQTRQFYGKQVQTNPWNAQYESTVSGLNNQLNQQQADITGREIATQQQYGFTDQSNPFSLARGLEMQAAQQRNRTTNSYAGAGQLYSGAMSRARGQDEFAYGQGLDDLSRKYQAALAGLSNERLESQNDYQSQLTQAEAQRLEDTLNNPATDPGPDPRFVTATKKRLRGRIQTAKKHDKDALAKRLRQRLQNFS